MEHPKPKPFVGIEEHGKARKSIKSKISLALNKNQLRGLKSQQRLITKFQRKCQQVMNNSGGLDDGPSGSSDMAKTEDVAVEDPLKAKASSQMPRDEDLLTA